MASSCRRVDSILLVEDNPDDEELTLIAFKKNKLANRIDIVRDGAEALDYLFCTGVWSERDPRDKPRLVLLDLKLPKIGGLEVLKRMRENPVTQCIPVVVLTTSSEDDDIIASYRNGANSFIRKPVDFNTFIKAVNQLGMYWLLLNETSASASA